MPAWEDALGIHYVKDRERQKIRQEPCRRHGCRALATCMPRLYVPRHAMSLARGDDISSLMDLELCDRHHYMLKAADFLHREEVRLMIANECRKQNCMPDFDKAVIGRVPLYDPDFMRMREARAKQRQN